jgi:hypothetical protein
MEITQKTIEIETILNTNIDYEKLEECIVKGFEDQLKIRFD